MLAGYRVLVVEDEALVASAISELLTEAEGVPIGPAASVWEARRLIKDGPTLDAALLDVNLSDGSVTPVLEALSARGILTVIYTGGVVPDDIRQRHPDLLTLSKPVLPAPDWRAAEADREFAAASGVWMNHDTRRSLLPLLLLARKHPLSAPKVAQVAAV